MNTRMLGYRLIDPRRLTPTEEVDNTHVAELEGEIRRRGAWTMPIAVHGNALFVMDGHHRLAVALRLHLEVMPVILLDYDTVEVTGWRNDEIITPQSIFAMARSGRKFPHKTTRHLFKSPLPECMIPLDELIHPHITGCFGRTGYHVDVLAT